MERGRAKEGQKQAQPNRPPESGSPAIGIHFTQLPDKVQRSARELELHLPYQP